MLIKKKVGQLVKKYNTNNPIQLAEELGIKVEYEPLGTILGYYSKSHRIKVIHINESASSEKQFFICSHELGHAVLHPNVNTPFLKTNTLFSTDKIEQEANEFAIELMLSKDVVSPITLDEAIEVYGIPRQHLYKKIYV